MKRNQRILALMLVIITLFTLLPVSALASSKVQTLKFGKWYNKLDELSDDGNTEIIYKIEMKTDSPIKVDIKSSAFIFLYRDKECKYKIREWYRDDTDEIVILYRGTYYAKMYNLYPQQEAAIRISAKKMKNKPNYCARKAITMAKNKVYQIGQTLNENYVRWYKIKLTKSQVISIIKDIPYFRITVYDSDFESIDCKYNDETHILATRGRQPKGTYYISIGEDVFDSLKYFGKYYTLSWK